MSSAASAASAAAHGRTVPWEGSNRRQELPPDWPQIRQEVLERDEYTCQIGMEDRCTVYATDVDHKVPGSDHSMDNLRAACNPCHQFKSSQEGAAARPRLHRPPEAHPAFG